MISIRIADTCYEVLCACPADAVAFLDAYQSRQACVSAALAADRITALRADLRTGVQRRVFDVLLTRPNGVSGAEIAKTAEMGGVDGVGSVLRAIENAMTRLDIDDLRIRRARAWIDDCSHETLVRLVRVVDGKDRPYGPVVEDANVA